MSIRKKYEKITKRQKTLVTAEDVATIKEEAEAARKLLELPEFQFFRDYLKNTQKSIIDLFVCNRIKGVRETTTDDNGVTKEFETTKQEQLDELAGQYKFIETMFQDLRNFVDLPNELEKAKKTGNVDVVDSEEG